jgi:hypothetical protein
MSIVLPNTTHIEIPSRSPVRPAAPLDPGSPAGDREVSFELQSRGGYLRTVNGTIAYFDEEAQTSMVEASGGALMRVPTRDITGTIEIVAVTH